MKELSNEEKARTIIGEDCKRENCLQCGGIYSAEKGGCVEYQKIMQMAQWKDEQFDKFISSMGLVVKEMYEQYKERRQTPTDNKSTLYLLQNPEIQKEVNELANKLSVSFIGKEITFNTPTCQVTFKFN